MGACSSWNHPLTPAENRRGDHTQHPAHPLALEFQFSTAATFLLLPDALLRLTLLRCWPRHPKNNGGLAVVSPDAAPAALFSPLFGKPLTHRHQTRISFAPTTPWCSGLESWKRTTKAIR